MKCEEFWEKWEESLGQCNLKEQRQHLKECKDCRQSLELLHEGLSELKRDILSDEPAEFWHDMKKEVIKGVNMPAKQGILQNKWFRFFGVLIPALAALFLFWTFSFKVTNQQLVTPPAITTEDVFILAGGLPEETITMDASDYGEIQEDGELDQEDDYVDQDVFTGVSDPMAALFMETS